MNTLGLPHTSVTDEEYATGRSHSGDVYQMRYPKGTQKEETQVYRTSFAYVNQPRSDEDICMQTTQENAPNGRLLLCRDSFGNALHPFLAEDFREAIITRQMPYPLEQVQEGDTVIIGIVERNLPDILKYAPDLVNKAEP